MFYFHILYLNVSEWVSVKGCILGIWIDGPCVPLLLLGDPGWVMIILLYRMYVG